MAFKLDSLKRALASSQRDTQLESVDLEGIAKLIKDGKVKNIITAVGAGISTSAGIPDFRSPTTGIYHNLDQYDLPNPMAVFDIDYFRTNPEPFFEVARRLYRPHARPTIAHYFIKLLEEKGILLRHYTQNVDRLERISGLPEDKMIEAHGSFHTGHCLVCRKEYPFSFFEEKIFTKVVPKCAEEGCDGVVKPDVVFFGEGLPSAFTRGVKRDFPKCDLLIIMGTSLQIMPFCGIVNCTKKGVPRLYINREYTDGSSSSRPLRWQESDNMTDVFAAGDADSTCMHLADLIGWKADLVSIQRRRNLELDNRLGETAGVNSTSG